MMTFPSIQSRIQYLDRIKGVEIHLLREDELHPDVSGNKFRKLKYNFEDFHKGDFSSILTFGGAFSNHIAATAAAAQLCGIPSIGVIRGEELASQIQFNPTLKFAQNCGMQFKFVSREAYRQKTSDEFLVQLQKEFGRVFIVPEGGTNQAAIKGCEEILDERTHIFDYISSPVGTGGTLSGLIKSAQEYQKILGFPALKDSNFLFDEIKRFTHRSNFELIQDYHFGGYAKYSDELLDFINHFKSQYAVPLDPIYTGKMMFGIFKLIESGFFPSSTKILAIHTGGLQGITGFNQKLKQKNKTLIS